ncbi:MAG: hypothetical protein M3019_04315 [Candidatus Dormibacteraeota bacterium]|nr:hypothetical protein [Candidatus Dormibacteraeota bacterium]
MREGTVEVSDVADLSDLADDEEFVAAVVPSWRRHGMTRCRATRACSGSGME